MGVYLRKNENKKVMKKVIKKAIAGFELSTRSDENQDFFRKIAMLVVIAVLSFFLVSLF